jgi:hypothetical protein
MKHKVYLGIMFYDRACFQSMCFSSCSTRKPIKLLCKAYIPSSQIREKQGRKKLCKVPSISH